MSKHGNNSKSNKGGGFPYKKGGTTVVEEKKVVTEILVNANVNPQLPVGLKFGRHEQVGSWTLKLTNGELYANGRKVEIISCTGPLGVMLSVAEMKEKMAGRVVLNANFRDALDANSAFIPKSWDGKEVFFPATAFTTPSGDPCIPYMYKIGSMWSTHNLPIAKDQKDAYLGKHAFVAFI